MATVNKDFVVKNGVVAGANVQGVQLVSTTSSLPPLTVTSSANVVNLSADLLDGLHGSHYLDWTNTTNKPDLTFALQLGGGLVGSGSVTFTDLGNATLVLSDAGVALDGVTLGIETYGDYVESVKAGTGVTVSHQSGESASPTISIGQDVATSANVSFNTITSTTTSVSPFTVSSSVQVNNLNSQYLGGYTVAQLLGMSGVQSVIGTANEITVSASTGNIQVGLPDNVTIAGSLTVNENLIVTGSTVVVNSTVVTIDDPIFTVGGDTAGIDDGKDRGIEFKWNDGVNPRVGFFGFDESSGKFTFIPDATNTSEVFSGTKGTIDANVEWADVLNKPDPIIGVALSGDVLGSASTTLTDLANGQISITTYLNTSASISWSNVSNKPDPIIGVELTGQVVGAASATLTDLSNGQISISTSISSLPTITLGTDTSGNYVDGIYGTANQILVAGSGVESASVVLSLPQDIATTSTPTFVGVNVNHGSVTSASVLVTANSTPTLIDSFSTSAFTTAEYLIQAKQNTKMTATRVTVMWDGTDVSVSEYSIIDSAAGAANVSFTASESSGTVSLTASSPDAASTNITVKAVRTAVDA